MIIKHKHKPNYILQTLENCTRVQKKYPTIENEYEKSSQCNYVSLLRWVVHPPKKK